MAYDSAKRSESEPSDVVAKDGDDVRKGSGTDPSKKKELKSDGDFDYRGVGGLAFYAAFNVFASLLLNPRALPLLYHTLFLSIS